MRLTDNQATKVKDTLDYSAHHANKHLHAPEMPQCTLIQQRSNICAPKLHNANAFSALKRHLPPQQVVTGNALSLAVEQGALLATKNNTSMTVLSPFDPSSIRPHSLIREKNIYFLPLRPI
ncbi:MULTISPECIES: hypothetical protein [Pseudomonas]|uniref:Uncharacterized protein n=1 Tax=Pseudomonas kulmbachensis TaxID=3043408 RepID=A0ABW7M3A9_9PSED|nr:MULTISPECIES: hypothetical protein [Pseudomonas]UXL37406.1 hypothetical protein N7D90_17760 [Pseudomonas fragi]